MKAAPFVNQRGCSSPHTGHNADRLEARPALSSGGWKQIRGRFNCTDQSRRGDLWDRVYMATTMRTRGTGGRHGQSSWTVQIDAYKTGCYATLARSRREARSRRLLRWEFASEASERLTPDGSESGAPPPARPMSQAGD